MKGVRYFNITHIDIHELWEEVHDYIYGRWKGYLDQIQITQITNDSIVMFFYHRLNEHISTDHALSLVNVNTMAIKHANLSDFFGVGDYVFQILNWMDGNEDELGQLVSYHLLVETQHIGRVMFESVVNRDRRGDLVMVDLGADPYYLSVKIYGFKE